FSADALKARKQEVVNELLHHAVTGNQAAVEKMIKKDPALLLERGQTTDLSGRRFENVTALMLAAGAEDPDMTAVIDTALDARYPGEKLRQYQAQFPAEEEKNALQREADYIVKAEKIFVVISSASQRT